MKPRLAESGPDLWAAIKELNITGVVPPGGGVYWPAIRIVAGATFVLDVNLKPHAVTGFGLSTRTPQPRELRELEDAVEKDQVEVLILTRPGYESGYTHQKTKMVLHSPSGNSFNKGNSK
jgi:hypothetical protein